MKLFVQLVCAASVFLPCAAQQKTYCNPVNIDYAYCLGICANGQHRSTADPVILMYEDDYYLFSTNQGGYWWSENLSDWNFVRRSFVTPEGPGEDLCAPAAWVQGDTLLVFGSTYTRDFPIWMSTDPKANKWEKAIDKFDIGGWDPAFFVDDDGRLYMYNGSSNAFPIYGVELDRRTFEPLGDRKPLLLCDDGQIGWHRFGELLDNTLMRPFIEGAWMTKHNGKYYLQWGGPGTEFSHYADGVTIGDGPLGGETSYFAHQSLPLSIKAGGFIRGAGHGSTFTDRWGNYWHTATMTISVKNNFERRIGMWPAGFDAEGDMYCNTAFGDYPHYLPDGVENHLESRFTGWMLLNYNKPVQVSSTLGGYSANYLVDESVKTYWSAKSGNKGEWIISDLGCVSTVRAVQINYADQDAALQGKVDGISHKYVIYASEDGKRWKKIIDKSKNDKDVPHDYVELAVPVRARFLKMENIAVPTGKFALSGFRVFGNGNGSKPSAVEGFVVMRGDDDRRNAWIKWKPVDDAYAYNIYYGVDKDKLYNCVMVYGANEYWFKVMDRSKPYYFAIEAINENGVSEWTRTEAL